MAKVLSMNFSELPNGKRVRSRQGKVGNFLYQLHLLNTWWMCENPYNGVSGETNVVENLKKIYWRIGACCICNKSIFHF